MSSTTPAQTETEIRKGRHLDVCLEDDVRSFVPTGFARVRLRHEALPEIDLAEVDASVSFLGKRLAAPLLISSMTGGTPRAGQINERLARAAEATGIAMALGSQRAALEDPTQLPTFAMRAVAPNVVLYANIGAVQLNYGVGIDDARAIVDDVQADGLFLHLNPLQEALQPRGDVDFRGLLGKIARLVRALAVPVIVKGVGSGISVATARRLLDAGVAAIDVAGAGGTSWARVEGRRASDDRRERLAETFGGWGYPTVEATRALRAEFPDAVIIASGGVRSGLDVAKALAIGADLVGMALPLLEPATRSVEAVREAIDDVIAGLRIALFASGGARIADLCGALLSAESGFGSAR